MISLSRVNAALLWDYNRSYNGEGVVLSWGCGDRFAIIIFSVQKVWGADGAHKF